MSTIESPGAPGDGGGHHEVADTIEIRSLHDAAQMRDVVEVFGQVWGTTQAVVPMEMLVAIAHSGGYVSAAFDTGDSESAADGHARILGASVAILSRHGGRPALHSHVTGLLPGARATGLGRAMKIHQRRWAADNGVEWIVWTFDPLVRRNAWFNIGVLGADVHEYLPSFYGPMSDSINAGDDSDRLLCAWSVDVSEPVGRDGNDAPDDALRIATPDDIVGLRRTDPADVRRWRSTTREAFQHAFADGRSVIGFTRSGDYVLT